MQDYNKIMIVNSEIILKNLTSVILMHKKIKNNKKTNNFYILNKILNSLNKINF